MVNSIVKARTAARAAVESLYEGTAVIYQSKELAQNSSSRILTVQKEVLYDNVPCRLSFWLGSYARTPVASVSETASGLQQNITLFLAPEYTVPPGCIIEVTQDGVTREYAASSVPLAYTTHQEINLQLVDKKA